MSNYVFFLCVISLIYIILYRFDKINSAIDLNKKTKIIEQIGLILRLQILKITQFTRNNFVSLISPLFSKFSDSEMTTLDFALYAISRGRSMDEHGCM